MEILKAGILVIGDEILSGRTHDTNSNFIAKKLNDSGISLEEIKVIKDQKTVIIKNIKSFKNKYNYVFTTGGIGPTHDDITAESISEALNLRYCFHDEAYRILENYYPKGEFNIGRKKMAKMPENAELIVNPMTGDILAMSTLPSFNPNKYYDYEIEHYKNKIISDSYEPGSTFKIVALSGILDLDIHNDEDKFYCENGETTLINRKKLRDHEPHEFLNISEIFTYSSNIGMSKIVTDLESKDFYKYCKLYGFGTKSGISLSDEASGNIRGLDNWSKTSKIYLSIGQELSVTNLQLAMAYAAIANGYEPSYSKISPAI